MKIAAVGRFRAAVWVVTGRTVKQAPAARWSPPATRGTLVRKAKIAAGFVFVFCAIGLVGRMDYEDQAEAERAFCARLRNGVGLVHETPVRSDCRLPPLRQ